MKTVVVLTVHDHDNSSIAGERRSYRRRKGTKSEVKQEFYHHTVKSVPERYLSCYGWLCTRAFPVARWLAPEKDRMQSLLEIRLLGPFELRVDGQPVTPLHSRKEHWLLSLLILRQGRLIERDWLAGTLWPETEQSQALFYLRSTLADLRKSLGPYASRIGSPSRHTLSLDLAEVEVDLVTFDAAVESGDTDCLEQAVALYRGPLLEGCTEEWVQLDRQVREQSCLTMLERLAAQAMTGGDADRAVGFLQRVITIDPLRESAQRDLMRAMAAAGDYAAAVQVYRNLRSYLRAEMNTEPDSETRALLQQFQEEARLREQALARSAALAASSTGERETSISLRLIPRPITELIGREEELRSVRSMLASSRLVTLTGTGGIGKTRLALRVAEDRADDYPDGVWFVELAALSDPGLIAQRVVRRLKVAEIPNQPLEETLLEFLGPRRALLALDNCEHLLEACTQFTETILHACPQITILATSRERLGIVGEQTYRVPSLSVPPGKARQTPDEIMGYEAACLLVTRAKQSHPAFTLDNRNATAVAQICHRLDGIPLAIELAAARVRVLSVEEINARLDDRYRVLTGGSRTALPRQQTLRALMDWSYDLLRPEERLLFHRISVFVGGWSMEAMESVCAVPVSPDSVAISPNLLAQNPTIATEDVLDLISSLVDKSLVVHETNEVGVSRYRLLESIGQYAQERLGESGEEVVLRRRHRDYYLAFVEATAPKLAGTEQMQWMGTLETEHENIRAALTWSQSAPEETEAILRMANGMTRFWYAHGHLREGRRWLEDALSRPVAVSESIRASALNAAGILAMTQGDLEKAREHHWECLGIRQAMGDVAGIASSYNNLGLLAQGSRDFAAMRHYHEKSLAIYRQFGDEAGEAATLNNLGIAAVGQGDYTEARNHYEQAWALLRKQGQMMQVSIVLNNLGDIARICKDYKTAHVRLKESLSLHRSHGMEINLVMVESLTDMGIIATSYREYRRAITLLACAHSIREALGTRLHSSAHEDYEVSIAKLRAELGQKEYEELWHQGLDLTPEQAIQVALDLPSIEEAHLMQPGSSSSRRS